MLATSVRRLFVLLCGFEILPKSVSTRGLGSRFILSEPVCAYLLDTDEGWVLLDTGLDARNGNDAIRRQQRFVGHGLSPPVIREQHLLEAQLEEIGIGNGDIGHVILSHMHYDHAGNLRLFTHARISVQRHEHRYAFGTETGSAYFRDEYDLPGLNWELRDGDWQAVPGLQLIATDGHTPGHQSALVHLPQTGPVLLPFDAADLAENFEQGVLPGECSNIEAAERSLTHLRSLARQYSALVLYFHDPVSIQSMQLAPACYR
jgi:N-acyl homoserine lactone hydrolase